MIRRRDEYVNDENGRLVDVWVATTPGNKDKYMGRSSLDKTTTAPDGRKVVESTEIGFPIEAKSLEEAFEKHEECVKDVLKEITKNEKKIKIPTPSKVIKIGGNGRNN